MGIPPATFLSGLECLWCGAQWGWSWLLQYPKEDQGPSSWSLGGPTSLQFLEQAEPLLESNWKELEPGEGLLPDPPTKGLALGDTERCVLCWGRGSVDGQDCLWPVTERDWIQVTEPFQALQQNRGLWACLGAQTRVSPALLLGGKSIPGLQWRGARTKLQDLCRACVELRLGHHPPRAQTDVTPGSCLGEEGCSQPEAGSQRSQKSTVVPNCCYWRAVWVGRAPVPPSCWCHLGNWHFRDVTSERKTTNTHKCLCVCVL